MLYANIEDLVFPWDLIALGSIYSFMMVIEENNYIK